MTRRRNRTLGTFGSQMEWFFSLGTPPPSHARAPTSSIPALLCSRINVWEDVSL